MPHSEYTRVKLLEQISDLVENGATLTVVTPSGEEPMNYPLAPTVHLAPDDAHFCTVRPIVTRTADPDSLLHYPKCSLASIPLLGEVTGSTYVVETGDYKFTISVAPEDQQAVINAWMEWLSRLPEWLQAALLEHDDEALERMGWGTFESIEL